VQRQKALAKLHAGCKHPVSEILEGRYEPESTYAYAKPEFRVCKLCGYAEEGWGSGFWKLARGIYDGIPQLSRDEAFKYVLKFHTQDDLYKLKYPDRKHD
jgi:hypothetical protein